MQKNGSVLALRRVVTGHDNEGRSVISQDSASPFVLRTSDSGPVVTDLWKTSATPADNAAQSEPCGPVSLAPAAGGSVFRVVQFPPDASYMQQWDEHAAFAAMGHAMSGVSSRKGATVGMHRTKSLDYAVVISGEIWAVMDEGESLLRPGDSLVQRGTNHGWSNRTSAPAVVAFVLIDALPLPGQ